MYEPAAAAKARAEITQGQRAAALYKEAQILAEANMRDFAVSLEILLSQAAEIADGGDLYPAGVRDICRKLGETAAGRAQSISAILRNDGQPVPPRDDAPAPRPTQNETAPSPGRDVIEDPARPAFVPLEDLASHLSQFGRRDGTLPGDFAARR